MTDGEEKFLDKAYSLNGPEDTNNFYDDWAATYEKEIRENGYATPERCAKALKSLADDLNAPVLDLGCGTGLGGEALKAEGFTTLDGTDFSKEMLAYAEKKPGLYRKLTLGDLNTPIPATPGDYTHMTAVGVLATDHAPPETIDQIIPLLPSGGCFVFSLNDHTLKDPNFERKVNALPAAGTVTIAFREYGPHLPGHGLQALVYGLRKV